MAYYPETYWRERAASQGPSYVARGGRVSNYNAQREALEPFLWVLQGRTKVLDFGCGPGRFQPALERLGMDYHGVDLIEGYCTRPMGSVEPEEFDAAVAIFVLQHIVDEVQYEGAVRYLWRALAPGGVLFVVDHIPQEGMAAHMRPRGLAGLTNAQDWKSAHHLATYDGHWVGVLTK